MGIYIKGMEMPKGGYRTVEIAFDADGHPMALADGGDVFDVIPVPPHGRCIDENALLKGCGYIIADGMACIPVKYIANAPTIIPAEEGKT